MRVCICVNASVGAKKRNQSTVRVSESAWKHVCFVIYFEGGRKAGISHYKWGKGVSPRHLRAQAILPAVFARAWVLGWMSN